MYIVIDNTVNNHNYKAGQLICIAEAYLNMEECNNKIIFAK